MESKSGHRRPHPRPWDIWRDSEAYDAAFDQEIRRPGNRARHLVRSKVRGDEGLDCFPFFIFGFVTCSLRRTPRPPAELVTPGLINSMPAFSSAETSFISESTLPRTTPSLASMR